LGKLKEHGFTGNIAYDFLNDYNLTGQVLLKPFIADRLPKNPLTGYPTFINLDGSNHYEPPIIEMCSVSFTFLKPFKLSKLNASQFSKKFKNTILVRQPHKIRGLINRTYNNIRTGFINPPKIVISKLKDIKETLNDN